MNLSDFPNLNVPSIAEFNLNTIPSSSPDFLSKPISLPGISRHMPISGPMPNTISFPISGITPKPIPQPNITSPIMTPQPIPLPGINRPMPISGPMPISEPIPDTISFPI